MHVRTWALCASALLFGIIAAGCQEGQPAAAQLSKLELQVDAASPYRPGHVAAVAGEDGVHRSAVIAPDPTAVRVSITGADFGELSQTVAFGATSLSFLVPAGPARTITLVFLTGTGAILGTGQTVVDVAGATQVVNVTVTAGIPNTNISSTTVPATNALQNKPFTVSSALVNNTNGSLTVTSAGHRFRTQGALADVSGAFAEAPAAFSTAPGATSNYATTVVPSTMAAPGLYQIDGVVEGTSTLAGAFAIRTSFVPATLRLIREHLVRLIEGQGGAGGFQERNGAVPSQWNSPIGVTRIPQGVVIADKLNHRVRLIGSVNGSPVTTTILGTGSSTPSTGTSAPGTPVSFPHGVGVLSTGEVVVCETGGNRVRAFQVNGRLRTIAGQVTAGFGGDGFAANDPSVQLDAPEDVLVVPGPFGDTLFISDTGNQVVRRIDPVSSFINTIAGVPNQAGDTGDGGVATSARLNRPAALAIDLTGNLLIAHEFADGTGGIRGLIRRVDLVTRRISTIAGSRDSTPLVGFDPEGLPATATRLGRINGIAVDAVSGFVYFTEQGAGSGRVLVIDPEGNLRTVAGTGTASPGNAALPGTDVILSGPQRLLLDSGQFVFPTSGGNTILRLQ